MNQREKSRRTNGLLLDAAASEFAVRGFAGTTLKDVVARTGMTKGALYAHFDSKEAMADALAAQTVQVWRDVARTVMDGGQSGVCRLNALIEALVDLLRRDVRARAVMRLMVEEAHQTGRISPLFQEMSDLVQRLLLQAQRQGEVDDSHRIDTLSHLVLATLLGAYYIEPAIAGEHEAGERTGAVWTMLLMTLSGDRVSRCRT